MDPLDLSSDSNADPRGGVSRAMTVGDDSAPTDLHLREELQRRTEYEICKRIGQGGMGIVYRAVHGKLKRPAAIKVLPPGRRNDSAAILRFQNEMEAVGKLDDPHIVRAYDAGEIEGTYYLVMEYVEGVDCGALVRNGSRLRIADACEIVRQAAEGLQHAFEHGLVHRDIKPSNILLTKNGSVKLADLGLARLTMFDTDDPLTMSNQLVGTIDYMAPEQAENSRQVDIRADLYSLGCTLFRFVTGRVPFGEPRFATAVQKALAHATAPPPSLSNFRADAPAELDRIVKRMLAKQPESRFSTPAELAAALEPWSAEHDLGELAATAFEKGGHGTWGDASTVTTGPDNSAGGRAKARRRNAWRLAAVAALFAALAAVAGLWSISKGSAATAWTEALSFAPREVEHPGRGNTSRWHFDDPTGALVVVSGRPCLIQLGMIEGGRYLVGVDVQQDEWQGGCGIFLGFQLGDPSGEQTEEFHVVEIQQSLDPQLRPILIVNRRQTSLSLSDGSPLDGKHFSETVPVPRGKWARLEIEFDDDEVRRIEFDDRVLTSLVSSKAVRNRFPGFRGSGAWGLYTFVESAGFLNPDIDQLQESSR